MEGSALELKWGIDGLRESASSGDNIVIIDAIRFTSAVATAIALGFVIEPTSEKGRGSETFSLSPRSFFGKSPGRVVIASSNGAFMAINSKGAKTTIFGSILNAKSIGKYLDSLEGNSTLLASGELGPETRAGLLSDYERKKSESNPIFAAEDFITAGAIASFCQMERSNEVREAEKLFESNRDGLLGYFRTTASHRYNTAKGNGEDTEYCCKLNAYDVIPELEWVGGIPEIKRLPI